MTIDETIGILRAVGTWNSKYILPLDQNLNLATYADTDATER
jgi:hypothetical protein